LFYREVRFISKGHVGVDSLTDNAQWFTIINASYINWNPLKHKEVLDMNYPDILLSYLYKSKDKW
jgi:hypothetical protein